MSQERLDLARDIVRVAHLTGTFRLRSGQLSAQYFDKYQFETDPTLLRRVAAALTSLVPPETHLLAGLELGGIPLATALAFEVGVPVVFVRKQRKAYGTEKLAEGAAIAGRRLCLVEDVITTGGQVIESATALRSLGAIVDHAVCVIWRGPGEARRLADAGLQVRHLFNMSDLTPWMALRGE
jgi:orotate phosphoribosyltransferase